MRFCFWNNIHHPNFGKHLERQMKKTGGNYVRRLDTDTGAGGKSLNEEKLNWIKKHFKR